MVKKVEKSLRAGSMRSGSMASTRNGSSAAEKNSLNDVNAKKSSVRSGSAGKGSYLYFFSLFSLLFFCTFSKLNEQLFD